jgi:L-threonylcarbamoyladenylate synthase
VGLPTETVYGLAADATRPEAVVKIFEIKERPFFDPLIVHVPDALAARNLIALDRITEPWFDTLTSHFWPGPLTLVLPRVTERVPDLVTSGQPTVAVRCPAHPVTRAVLRDFGRPLAAPSANRFGRISPTSAEHVKAELGGRIRVILDAGPTRHGLESTIIQLQGRLATILRHGPITAEQLREIGLEVRERASGGEGQEQTGDQAQPAPGMLKSHYAPRTPLQLVPSAADVPEPWRAQAGILLWNSAADAPAVRAFSAAEVLSPSHDLAEAAQNLFRAMRRLDDAGLDKIYAEPLPRTGLGQAIMDRLDRAAAERP